MPTVAVVLLRSTTRQHAGRCRLLPVILQPSIHTTTRLKARKCRLWGLLGSVLFGCRPVGRRDLGLSILQNGTCNPGDYGDDGVLNNIQADGAVPIIGFGGGANIPASWEARCQPPSGPTIPCSDTEFQNILIGGLQHLATAFPAITLIHDANEPDCNGGGNGCDNGAFQMSTIVQLSHDIAVAANTVNAQLGTKHFLHGGLIRRFANTSIWMALLLVLLLLGRRQILFHITSIRKQILWIALIRSKVPFPIMGLILICCRFVRNALPLAQSPEPPNRP